MAIRRRKRKYKTPLLPEGEFLLVDVYGAYDGPFNSNDFVREHDGTLVAQTEGRPVFLRCEKIEQDTIWTRDGNGKGELHELRIVPASSFNPV